MNHYEVLGVGFLAGVAEIRTAYLQRALELHPDKPGGNKAKFQSLVEAFEVLSSAARRSEYDSLIARASISLCPLGAHYEANCHARCHGTSSPHQHGCGIFVKRPSCFFDTFRASRASWGYRGMPRKDAC